ncbi:MlaC/ttg2D family ABC transporter substrate-binding protein [Halodesulfovibrio marinisediminis]|uniref:Phospholipid transport system substrate-binding protein n=1 Tax=Halodesulfovibrio marinisediminis DSM 17456 TaxID=1121457 RepID=A0A1N6DDV2_9BACT|nr:ABC transporter substrate-binding protein [Halodesulfovibrio marinisediminis]SIN69000.1 phospholipid transport system substrate-binding protein [Halodesulfovibrio marinisediminis DSM 17456]
MSKTYKRLLSPIISVFIVTLLFASTAFADAKQDAEEALQNAVNEITTTLNNANLDNVTENSVVVSQLEAEILKIFSMEQFSMRTIGRKWNTFTPEQKTKFKDAFIELLKATYFKHVSKYNGQRLDILGSRTNKSGNKVEVRTSVKYKNEDVPVNYRMLREDGKWMVYDVLVEGVSLVKNYRTQFSEILRKGTPDELIAKLQEKAVQVRKQQATAGKK